MKGNQNHPYAEIVVENQETKVVYQQPYHQLSTFFEGWLVRQQSFLEQLLHSISSDTTNQQTSLIQQVLAHYQEYYEEKAKIPRNDVFLLFCPPWLSSFERSLLWVAGYKPYLVFKIVDGAVNDLKAEQTLRMEEVKVETVKKEKELTETLARLQESVVALPMLALARQVGRLMDGEIFSLDLAVEALNTAMLQVIEGANSLRKSTASKVVEILSPIQIVKFLATAAQFHLQTRRWGLQRDS
ncbi:hypothetical protein CMV_024818 [Castanea mollissima]|uniref:DOG1 domain-containing protein n=1 Tax=Castanea mollissima TaxID=60419 RepID=A0A8J4QDN4_9ROSI|nr:hypothetical protein CMV_024818 [Castanea mollissima]